MEPPARASLPELPQPVVSNPHLCRHQQTGSLLFSALNCYTYFAVYKKKRSTKRIGNLENYEKQGTYNQQSKNSACAFCSTSF